MSIFVGVTRERVFSPGRVDDDRAIIDLVAQHLRADGHAVSLLDADDSVWPEPPAAALVFAMCQGTSALHRLRAWEQRGLRIINSPDGILNCRRHHTIATLTAPGVAFPESLLLDTATAAEPPDWLHEGGAWLKRGDFHATEAGDVMRLDTAEALRDALRHFQQRGIRKVVLQRHVPGRVLKFYAVRGRFFYCARPADGFVVAPDVLQKLDDLGQQAACALRVEVYGGDCVCGITGRLTLIDLNDWPSYASCRPAGAKAIAAYLDAQALATRT